MRHKYVPLVTAAAAFLLSAAITHAQVVAFDTNIQPGNQSWTGNLGLDFNVTAGHPILVTALGAFDNNADGFTGTVNVTIYNRDTVVQVCGPVAISGTVGTLVNGNRFIALTAPCVLPPGNYSVVAQGFNATDLNGNVGCVGNPAPTCVGPNPFTASALNTGGGLISFPGTGRYDSNAALDYPLLIDPNTNPYLAGTFQFQAVLAPTMTKTIATPLGDPDMNLGQTARITIKVINPNPIPLTNASFNDPLPSGLSFSNPVNVAVTCAAGTDPSGGVIFVNLATVPANGYCAVSFDVDGLAIGPQVNTTSTVTTNEAPPGGPATATVNVRWPYWYWFFAES